MKKIVAFLFCFVLLTKSSVLIAQSSDSSAIQQTLEVAIVDTIEVAPKQVHDFIRFADAIGHTVASPIRWDKKDWLTLGGVVAGSAALMLVDEPVREFWGNRDPDSWHVIERAGFHYGKPYAAYIMTGGFYIPGLVFKNKWMRETGLILGAAYLTSGAVQTIMKTVIGRARPGTDEGAWAYKPMSPEGGYHSLPSGHIQIAMVSAMVLAERVKSPILKGAFYATAGVTFLSRMESDSHWISDLAFGGAISYFCTKAIMKRMDQTKYDNPWKKKKSVSWKMFPSYNRVALVGSF